MDNSNPYLGYDQSLAEQFAQYKAKAPKDAIKALSRVRLQEVLVCTCGAESVGSMGHSDWCDKLPQARY